MGELVDVATLAHNSVEIVSIVVELPRRTASGAGNRYATVDPSPILSPTPMLRDARLGATEAPGEPGDRAAIATTSRTNFACATRVHGTSEADMKNVPVALTVKR